MKTTPLTDDEVAEKFGVARDSPAFDVARRLGDHRPDRVICELPEVACPHCGREFTATDEDVRRRTELPCTRCDRTIHIEHIEPPEGEDGDGPVLITLGTHPQES